MTNSMKMTLIKTLRRNGFAAWLRTTKDFKGEHIHFVMIQPGGRNDQGVLSPEAHRQVKEYYDGYDGLAGDGKDPQAWMNIAPVTFEAQHAKSSFPLGIGSTFSTTTHNGRASAGEALHVKKIQKRLSVSQTGYYGVITTGKVRAWQLWKGIKPTGAVGKATWDKLFPPS
jgi:peptidoglycan hydrolase-like protein with peptidoglycan-binding domain